ncbi:MAG: four helix bundle suffix domain-containing protein [Bacteroidales bacterium]
MSNDNNKFIPPHGGYQKLASYQMAEIVYDATVYFCNRYIDKRSRTHDQMVQAARSGKQNIAEGSMLSGTSKEAEIKLMGVARASLEELLNDYKDFLRVRGLPLWDKYDNRSLEIRKIGKEKDKSYNSYKTFFENDSLEVAVNAIICVIHQTNYLLDQQIRKLEELFLKEGGIRERMLKARLNERNKKK